MSELEEAENKHFTVVEELKRTKNLAQALELEAERRGKEVEVAREVMGDWKRRRAGREVREMSSK